MRWERRTIHPLHIDTKSNPSRKALHINHGETGRFTVELVRADTRVAFMGHTKDGKTHADVEPEVEYFVRFKVDAGPRVRARIYVDGKDLGYYMSVELSKEKQSFDKGLYSFDGFITAQQALKFAKAKVFHSADDTEELPFWTGNSEVKLYEILDTGENNTRQPFQHKWEGGDVGYVGGQYDPKKKGVMSTE